MSNSIEIKRQPHWLPQRGATLILFLLPSCDFQHLMASLTAEVQHTHTHIHTHVHTHWLHFLGSSRSFDRLHAQLEADKSLIRDAACSCLIDTVLCHRLAPRVSDPQADPQLPSRLTSRSGISFSTTTVPEVRHAALKLPCPLWWPVVEEL